jgi:23S rRNA (cytosine1962-C5)-methyltransferase
MIQLLGANDWSDYELIDCGSFEKLERFGYYILARPEPQAVWPKSLSEKEWQSITHAQFKRDKGNPEKGNWSFLKKMPEQWYIQYIHGNLSLQFRLGLTAFKHVGLFPEQSENWKYIYQKVQAQKQAKVLNLFAYTGGASLAAKCAGADVVHVDSVKQVVNWSRENMEASKLKDIRWVVEDALKFVKREAKRGNTYTGIILDPPAYGRGPEGEKWILEDMINELVSNCAQIIEKSNAFIVFNMYSMGLSYLVMQNLAKLHFKYIKSEEMGELYLSDRFEKKLPLGTYFRFETKNP